MTTEVDFFNQQANRPTKIKFWYQSDVETCNAKLCLSNSQNPQRIAIISHGAFGSPRSMNWLGYSLASQGWLVAGVAHYGESWVYGQETIDPSTVMRFWHRPQDISFAIDSLTKHQLFNIPLVTNKLLMIGHSSGGFTALATVGAKLDATKSQAYCSSKKALKDKGCLYSSKKQHQPISKEMINKIGHLQDQMQDERIVAAIALDPALGHATSKQSLQSINVPTLVIGSVNNDFLPFSEHATYYASHIKNANLAGIKHGAGHFIYIDQCDSEIKANGVPICKDRDGVDRKLLQRKTLGHIFSFINKNNLS
ncbi:hypothetical protein CW748_17325 [Alteromonadales bacterium alter-6D02]|nr:hypothetical protein CW748_17325 [Alteromonadales bacterium alter-6D02]